MVEVTKPKVQRSRSISPVWIIPIVAVVIAAWLSVRAWQERGTEIEIIFDSASGIEVGQTQIRLKDVPVGKVNQVLLSSDLSKVRVVATIERQVSQHLSENTRFWLVSPRVSASGVSNLGTLISGVYIVMDPGKAGDFHTTFKGLQEPPAIQSDEEGRQFVLLADTLGSLDIGSPVYYKQLKVGEVTSYKLADEADKVEIRVFIEAPHHKLVLTRSRFWNVSGVNFSVGAGGIKASVGSLASLISGGVAFESSTGFEAKERAPSEHEFYLHVDRDSVDEERYSLKYFYRLQFSHSVRGLNAGAPVEFRGIKIGAVEDVTLQKVANEADTLHVFISIEPQRLDPDLQPSREAFDQRMQALVAEGLRAQLKSGSLITGAQFIDLVFSEEQDAGQFRVHDNFSVLPTLDHPMTEIDEQLAQLTRQINRIPVAKIGEDLSASLASVKTILATLEEKNTAAKMDKTLDNVSLASEDLQSLLQALQKTVSQASATLQSIEATMAPDSHAQHELQQTLKSARRAADSLRVFLQNLNQKPDALIFGADANE